MSPKRIDRQLSSSPSNSADDSSDKNGTAQTGIEGLTPVPCLTCGREITPRAKWARNWSSIKYCSDSCKSWKSVVKVGEAPASALAKEGVQEDDTEANGQSTSILQQCLIPRDASLMLHIDAWLEASIMKQASSKNKKTAVPLADVADVMNAEMAQYSRPDIATHIRDKSLQVKPGFREMLRRAARRLVILPATSLAITHHLGAPSGKALVLTQNHGKITLRTLHDVSFAKGEIFVHCEEQRFSSKSIA